MEIKVEIRSPDEGDDEIFFAQHSAHVLLSRFGTEITDLELVLEQVGAPGAGTPAESAYRRCYGTAKGPRFGPVHVEATGPTSKQALSDALRKCATGIGRALFRPRDGEFSP